MCTDKQTKGMETCTSYFEKRNIHFYVNKFSFYIVEYQCEYNPRLEADDDFIGDAIFIIVEIFIIVYYNQFC